MKIFLKTGNLLVMPSLMVFIISNLLCMNVFALQYKSDGYYLNLIIPDDWKMVKAKKTPTTIFVSFRSKDKKRFLSIFQIKGNSKVDLDKLSDIDKKLFNNLGELESDKSFYSEKVRTYLILPTNRIEKVYKYGDNKSKLVFKSLLNFGYVIAYQGKVTDFSEFDAIIKDINIDIPLEERKHSAVTGGKIWIINTFNYLILIAILYVFGRLGALLRNNIEGKNLLNKIRTEFSKQGKDVNEKWHNHKKKATMWISLSILGCILIYISFYILLKYDLITTNQFLLSLLGIVAFAIGYYFRRLIVPNPEGMIDSLGKYI